METFVIIIAIYLIGVIFLLFLSRLYNSIRIKNGDKPDVFLAMIIFSWLGIIFESISMLFYLINKFIQKLFKLGKIDMESIMNELKRFIHEEN